jgi:Tol biopolymer transport system component
MVGPGQPVTSGNAGEVDIDSSPDGRKLAYRTTRGGKSEVREFDTSSRQERLLLASMDWRPTTPRWSADGRRLAYTRADSAATAIESPVTVLSIDGRAEQLVKLPGGAYLVPTHWSADGRALLGSCRLKPSDSMSVCSITIGDEGGSPSDLRVIAQDPSLNLWVPRFSPDQRWVAFVAVDVKDARTSRVFVAPSNGGDWTPVTNGQSFDDKPRWSPDGRTIYFVSSQDGFLNLWARRFDARTGNPDGASVRVTSFSGPEQLLPSSISRIEFAVTGDRLFVPLTEKTTNLWMLDQVDR